MIEVKGLDGESIVFDGTTVAKWPTIEADQRPVLDELVAALEASR